MRTAEQLLLQDNAMSIILPLHLDIIFFFFYTCSSWWHSHPFHVYCHSTDKKTPKTVHNILFVLCRIFFLSLIQLVVVSISAQHQCSCLTAAGCAAYIVCGHKEWQWVLLCWGWLQHQKGSVLKRGGEEDGCGCGCVWAAGIWGGLALQSWFLKRKP